MAMLALALFIGQEARLFTVLAVSADPACPDCENYFTPSARTNRIVESLLESIRSGDYNRKILRQACGSWISKAWPIRPRPLSTCHCLGKN